MAIQEAKQNDNVENHIEDKFTGENETKLDYELEVENEREIIDT